MRFDQTKSTITHLNEALPKNELGRHRLRPPLGLLVASLILVLSSCSVHFATAATTADNGTSRASTQGAAKVSSSSQTKTSGNASTTASTNAGKTTPSQAKASTKLKVSTSTGGSVSSSTHAPATVAFKVGANGKLLNETSGSSGGIFKSKARVKGLGKSKKNDSFSAHLKINGSGGLKNKSAAPATVSKNKNKVALPTAPKSKVSNGAPAGNPKDKTAASGTIPKAGSGVPKANPKDKTAVPATNPKDKTAVPATNPKDKTAVPATNPKDKTAVPATNPKDKTAVPATNPKDKTAVPATNPKDKTAVPIAPPAQAPDNVFGYDKPVRGCFEGIVYPLADGAQALPKTWDLLQGISAVYACEWDIPTRGWSMGFPGVSDLFEWFAIRYSGSFEVQQAGNWDFKISSDDGAKLFIDGKLVLDNDGQHSPQQITGSVVLSAGEHAMVLEYFQGPRYLINLQLYATPPGGQEGIFSVR